MSLASVLESFSEVPDVFVSSCLSCFEDTAIITKIEIEKNDSQTLIILIIMLEGSRINKNQNHLYLAHQT